MGQHGNRLKVKFSCFPHEAISGNRSLHGSVFSKYGSRITNITITHEVKSLAEKGLEIWIFFKHLKKILINLKFKNHQDTN